MAIKKTPTSYDSEPMIKKWRLVHDEHLRDAICSHLPKEQKNLILIDGRSGNGKSTFANKLANCIDAIIVHTDDISWHHHPFNWVQEIQDEVIIPWRMGRDINYKPPAWIAMNRKGSITAAAKSSLIIEGVGAGRSELARSDTLVIWVQANHADVYNRAIKRDMVNENRTRSQAEDFWAEWMSLEEPLIENDRPWTRAHYIVNGTPPKNTIPNATYIADGPLT